MNLKGKKNNRSKTSKAVLPNIYTLVRLAISVILLVLAYKIGASALVSTLMLVTALITGSFNIIISAVNAIKTKDYFNNSCLVLIAAAACFAAGCYIESVIFAVIYELGKELLDFALRLTRKNVIDTLPDNEAPEISRIKGILNRFDTVNNPLKQKLVPLFDVVTKAVFVIAVIYVIALPLVSDMTFVMSVRRGAMLIVAVLPTSAFASLSISTAAAAGYSASKGVILDNTDVMISAAKLKTVVFDKFDVITAGAPKISSIISPVMDNENFLKAIAYVAYKSEQKIASSIVAAYDGEIEPRYIQSFKDIPGYGMEVKISGQTILLGTLNLIHSRGISLSEDVIRKGNVLYLIISGQYAGSLIFNESINPYAAKTVDDLSQLGINSVLLSEDGAEICEKTASGIKITEYYPCCDTVKKLSTIKNIKQNLEENHTLMYVSADDIEYHTEANIDAKVGEGRYPADINMSNISIYGLASMVRYSKLSRKISAENVLVACIVKLICFILAITGNATVWFIALIDFAAGIFGVLNIAQMTDK